MIQFNEKIYTIKDVAEILSLSVPTVKKLIDKKKIVAFDVGCEKRKMYRVTKTELERYTRCNPKGFL